MMTTKAETTETTAEIVTLDPPKTMTPEQMVGHMANLVRDGEVNKLVMIGWKDNEQAFYFYSSDDMSFAEVNWQLDVAKDSLFSEAALLHAESEEEREE